MEPMLPALGSRGLEDLAVDLAKKGSALGGSLHPRDIDRALADQFSGNPRQRNLQLEAKAHIDVQRLIDAGNRPDVKATTEFLPWVHHEFCTRLPEELLPMEAVEHWLPRLYPAA